MPAPMHRQVSTMSSGCGVAERVATDVAAEHGLALAPDGALDGVEARAVGAARHTAPVGAGGSSGLRTALSRQTARASRTV